MPIVNFCVRDFRLVEERDITIERLVDLAAQTEGKHFVVHDPLHRASVLVSPVQLGKALQGDYIPPNASAAKMGLLSLLAQRPDRGE